MKFAVLSPSTALELSGESQGESFLLNNLNETKQISIFAREKWNKYGNKNENTFWIIVTFNHT